MAAISFSGIPPGSLWKKPVSHPAPIRQEPTHSGKKGGYLKNGAFQLGKRRHSHRDSRGSRRLSPLCVILLFPGFSPPASFADCLWVPQITAVHRAKAIIQLVDQGNPCGNIDLHNLLVGKIFQVFYQRPQGIAVGRGKAFLTKQAASCRPLSERSTSVRPVNRFRLFHWLSPCRTITS